jgi:hypothetical protein
MGRYSEAREDIVERVLRQQKVIKMRRNLPQSCIVILADNDVRGCDAITRLVLPCDDKRDDRVADRRTSPLKSFETACGADILTSFLTA